MTVVAIAAWAIRLKAPSRQTNQMRQQQVLDIDVASFGRRLSPLGGLPKPQFPVNFPVLKSPTAAEVVRVLRN
jgi:hypothetical protein